MTTITRILILLLIGITTTISAQDFQGVATYKSHQDFNMKIDSTKANDAMRKKIMERMKKQFQKTYLLTFDKNSSVYQQEAELDQPQFGDGLKMSFGNSGSDVFYKNIKDQNYIDQKEKLGKKFLIKDSIVRIKWQLESESKYIGEYLCFKATYTKQIPKDKYSFSNTNVDDDEELNEEVIELEERIVTVWYTPQIPVSNGPAKYQGLPGLILEIHDGDLTVICSKIVMNPEDKIEITQPDKGKEVSQSEYDVIMDKKMKEMMERYAPKRGSKDGAIHISIGG
ncbi:GLPGLI family protein [Winogradskyella undariae]|uniref:GLPGLI family protein n=1 Tax=Winogradskyella undariae TaxID=1285465 RepID=UPI0015C6D9A0|nr:GLPGLI family protein [Winogradskyella undariae]QNK76380.1 GLPGLI family protein [Winogradskyella sp. PAMC22761]